MNRPDGRKPDEARPVEAEVGIIEKADGSARFKIGNTVAIAAVYGPTEVHPRHLENSEKAIIKCVYDMYSFSVPDRKRPGPDRRSIELSMVIRNAVLPSVMVEKYPGQAIHLYVSIVQADAGTRCAAISAASMALADAGIAMRDLVASVAAGHILDNVVLDLNKDEEDIEGATDIPMAYMPRTNKVTLLQLDGKISGDKLKKAVQMGIKGCKDIYEVQKKALKDKYKNSKVVS